MLWCSELIKHSLISYIKIFNKAGRHILPEPCSHLIKILSVFHAKILHGIQDIKIYCVLWILQTCSIQDQDFIPWQRGSTLNSRSQPPKSVLSFPNMDFYPLTSVPKPFKSFFSFRNRGFHPLTSTSNLTFFIFFCLSSIRLFVPTFELQLLWLMPQWHKCPVRLNRWNNQHKRRFH